MTVILELRGFTVMFGEDLDEAVLTLEAEHIPLAWLSLLTEVDLQRLDFWQGSSATSPVSWAAQVQAAFTDSDLYGIPSLDIPWSVARTRLRAAVSHLEDRNDPWAVALAKWEEELIKLAAQGPAVRTVLDIGAAAASFNDADAFLSALLHGVRWWAEPDRIFRPQMDSVIELTGGPINGRLAWQAGGSVSVGVPTQANGERVIDASLAVLLSTVTLMTYGFTGSVWWASIAFLVIVASIVWRLLLQKNRGAPAPAHALLTLHPGSYPIKVKPPLLSVLVCCLLLLGGLLDLWGQVHRVQGACCSRAYYTYWPSRTWTELWVIGVLIMLGVVSQTVRLQGDRLTVTWLFGVLRLSRPTTQVRVEGVEPTVARQGNEVSGLRLRLGWLDVTLTEKQAGYAALRTACTPRSEVG